MKVETSSCVFIVNFEYISHLVLVSISIINFEHVIAGWVIILAKKTFWMFDWVLNMTLQRVAKTLLQRASVITN